MMSRPTLRQLARVCGKWWDKFGTEPILDVALCSLGSSMGSNLRRFASIGVVSRLVAGARLLENVHLYAEPFPLIIQGATSSILG